MFSFRGWGIPILSRCECRERTTNKQEVNFGKVLPDTPESNHIT